VKEQLLSTLRGYQRANEYMESERMARLAQMMPEESRNIFNDLVEGWEQIVSREKDLECFEQWHIEAHVVVRLAFKRMAELKGLLDQV
jgi:hypothetical protein